MKKFLLLSLICLTVEARAQSDLPPGLRGPGAGMATRSVTAYLALERKLLQAFEDGNKDAVERMLGEGFGAHKASDADEIAKEDWLAEELSRPIKSAIVQKLSVREFNDLAVVSFLLESPRVVKGKSVNTVFYVVDVWQQSPNLLLTRYVSQPQGRLPVSQKPDGRE